jgi:hypothetical protein
MGNGVFDLPRADNAGNDERDDDKSNSQPSDLSWRH